MFKGEQLAMNYPFSIVPVTKYGAAAGSAASPLRIEGKKQGKTAAITHVAKQSAALLYYVLTPQGAQRRSATIVANVMLTEADASKTWSPKFSGGNIWTPTGFKFGVFDNLGNEISPTPNTSKSGKFFATKAMVPASGKEEEWFSFGGSEGGGIEDRIVGLGAAQAALDAKVATMGLTIALTAPSLVPQDWVFA